MRGELDRAERIPQLVVEHLVEALKPRRVLLDRRRIFADERVDRRLHQRAHRAVDALRDVERDGCGQFEPEALAFLRDEREQDVGQQLVLMEQLMN